MAVVVVVRGLSLCHLTRPKTRPAASCNYLHLACCARLEDWPPAIMQLCLYLLLPWCSLWPASSHHPASLCLHWGWWV